MSDAPTSVHGRAIYTDPPEMALRPRGALGMMWWEESRADDPESVHFVLKSLALPEPGGEAERAAVERMVDAMVRVGVLRELGRLDGEYLAHAALRALRSSE